MGNSIEYRPRIGVRLNPAEKGAAFADIDEFEIDALDPIFQSGKNLKAFRSSLAAHQSPSLALGHFFLRAEDRVERRDRARIAAERAHFLGARSSVVIVPPSLFDAARTLASLETILSEYSRANLAAPEVDFAASKSAPPPSGAVVLAKTGDPTWFRRTAEYRRRFWRIHGHHPARWVRFYSEGEIDRLAELADRFRPERIFFLHSQRYAQALQFAKRRSRGSESKIEIERRT